MIQSKLLSQIDSIQHGFFTREGGVSLGVFNSLNCGYGSGDSAKNVNLNRAIALRKLGLKQKILNTVYQIHSTKTVIAEKIWKFNQHPKADAIVTKIPNLPIGVLSADCAPVLFADPENKVIAACHAGWRGAFGGILESCITAMENIGGKRDAIKAVIGPCIHQKSYEVDARFKNLFVDYDGHNQRFFVPSKQENHFQFDLPGYILQRLQKLGLLRSCNINVDTYEDKERFFSFRRSSHSSETNYGRGLSVITLRT
jgi:YfiH family protein